MDHDHDDGLVHSHGWAKEPPPSIGELLRPAQDERKARSPASAEPQRPDGAAR